MKAWVKQTTDGNGIVAGRAIIERGSKWQTCGPRPAIRLHRLDGAGLIMIRSARSEDIDDLVDLWMSVGLKVDRERTRAELSLLIDSGTDLILAAMDGETIIGAVLGTWDGRRGWIQRLATQPEHRGRGVAAQLMVELEQRLRAKGCGKVNLLVEPDNAGVVSFYERAGFTVDPLIFMEKWL